MAVYQAGGSFQTGGDYQPTGNWDFSKAASLTGVNASGVTGTITSSQVDPQLAQFISVPLSAAQITTLHSVPVTIIPAPGAGKVIVIDTLIFDFTYNSVQFTGGGAISAVFHGLSTNLLNSTVAATSIQAAANYAGQFVSAGTASGVLLTPGLNLGLDLSAAGADFAAGNSTAKVFVWYSVVTL